MSQPGTLGNQIPAGEDWISRKLADLERQIREMRAERSLESASIGDGGLRSANFDGDLATGQAGTEGWGLGGPDGRYAIFNDIVLRGGIIGNDALTNPIQAEANRAHAENFGLPTTTYAVLAQFNFTVPAGFTRGLVTAVAIVNAVNSTSGSDYIYVAPSINDVNGDTIYNGISGNGGGDGTLNIQYAALTGLSGGQSIPCQVKAATAFAAWAPNSQNWATINAQVIWTR